MSEIAQLLAAIDDASWEALGSKGLLRRATKELEKGVKCEVAEETAFSLKIHVGEAEVSVPREGPARAKCTCGAPGCCHHIIAAGLFCRKQSSLAASADLVAGSSAANPAVGASRGPATLDSILALDFSVVKKWCGAASWRAALRLLSSGVAIEVRDDKSALVVRLNPIGVQCRFLPGADLDGVIVGGGESKSGKSYVAAAVIGTKAEHGQSVPVEEVAETVLAEEKGASRSRGEVLETARELLESAVGAGLSHAGGTSAERFATLAVSAEGTNLPRLARSLKTVADELGMIASKHGRADAERALDAMAQAYALVVALENQGSNPSARLIGEHRSGYIELTSLDLVGITVFPWQARSGYRGVTVLFWSVGEGKWATWSEARSISSDPRYDPMKALDAEGPWNSNVPIRQLAQSRVELSHAKRSAAGRLSSTQGCKAKIIGPTRPEEIDFGGRQFVAWDALQHYIAASNTAGLRSPDPLSDWVVLMPARWTDPYFDRVKQRLVWSVMDGAGRQLWLVLGYSELTQGGIDRVEKWAPSQQGGVKIVGRLLRNEGTVAVEPLALLAASKTGVTSINLLAPPASTGAVTSPRSVSSADQTEDDELEGDATDEAASHPADRWCRLARDYVLRRAEAGGSESDAHHSQAERLADQLASAGLPILARALARTASGAKGVPRSLLRLAYLLRLHEQCQTIGA